MKKHIIILLTLLGIGTSCTKDFLKEEMVSVTTPDYFKTEQGLEQLITSTYDALRWRCAYEPGVYNFQLGADNSVLSGGATTWNIYSPSTWSASGAVGGRSNDLMGYYSKGIQGVYPLSHDCNLAIDIIKNTPPGKFATNATYTNQRLGELYFIQAYCYYQLTTQLGDVPIYTKVTYGKPSTLNLPKSSSKDVYTYIISRARFAFENLPDASTYGTGDVSRERLTKGAAAALLTKFYLQRAQGAEFENSSEVHLKMLYKGKGANDLDSAIYFASQIIDNTSQYRLENDFADVFKTAKGAYPCESSSEIILEAGFGPNNQPNTRFGMRFHGYFTPNYTTGGGSWGIPNATWQYGYAIVGMRPNDWAFDQFTNKFADSRFEKSFLIEYKPMLATSTTAYSDVDYYPYNDKNNTTNTWTADAAEYFNANVLPSYNRPSWGARKAVAGEHKIGGGDLGLVFLENTKETAIDIKVAMAQPYILHPRWTKDGDKYYYRRNASDNFVAENVGLEFGYNRVPGSSKHVDINRQGVKSDYGTRDVAIFRIAEIYLLRAEAYGRKNMWTEAIADINAVRHRAAYKAGESRAEVLARLYPGAENLPASERAWPYQTSRDYTAEMTVNATYWDGASEASKAENYPAPRAGADPTMWNFVNFIYNEISRETDSELQLLEGIHHAGIQYERILCHDQMASSLQNHWPKADNILSGQGQTGNGKGSVQKFHTFRPFPQDYINLIQNEAGQPLSDAEKAAYQNPGY